MLLRRHETGGQSSHLDAKSVRRTRLGGPSAEASRAWSQGLSLLDMARQAPALHAAQRVVLKIFGIPEVKMAVWTVFYT